MNKKQTLQPEVEHSTAYRVISAGRTLLQQMDARMESIGLSSAKMWALLWIARAEEAPSVTQLADCMSTTKSNITALVDRLIKDGLVQRIDDPDDRRVVLIQLTQQGRQRFLQGMLLFQQLNADVSTLMSDDEAAQLESCLNKIIDEMD